MTSYYCSVVSVEALNSVKHNTRHNKRA